MKDILLKDNKLEMQPLQIKGLDTEKGVVELYANVFGVVDSDRDISLPGSFVKTIKENRQRLRHFLNHDWRTLIGGPKDIYEDEKGLVAVSQLNLNKEVGRDIFEDYRLYSELGMSLEHSIGVEAVKYENDHSEEVRKVSEWKLWEYSTLTAWGANPEALTESIKTMNKDTIEYMLDKGNYSDNRYKLLEKINEALKTEPPYGTQADEPLQMLNKIAKSLQNG